jgi:hypothetical protein
MRVFRGTAPCIVLCIFLSGCSYVDYLEHSQGVQAPPPAAISDFALETEQGAVVQGDVPRQLSAGEYLTASWAYTDQKCHKFFDLLERFKQDSGLLDKVLTAAVAAASPLPQSTIASVTTSVAFANQLNLAAADIYAFSTFKDQLMPQVFGLMSCYRQPRGNNCQSKTVSGINWQDIVDNRIRTGTVGGYEKFLGSRALADLMIARGVAQEYASLCSLASLRGIVAGALSATRTAPATLNPVSTVTTAK